jgi:hemoglobin
MKSDIKNRRDVKKLVSRFYGNLLHDQEFKSIFLEVVKVDMEVHLEIMVDYWESVLFGTAKYKRNTVDVHIDLHLKYPVTHNHFNRWLQLFYKTIDENFTGEKATHAKDSALSMASVIKMRIDGLEKMRLELNN